MQERAGDGEPLPHATREFAHQAVADALQAGAFQPFVGRLLGLAGRRVAEERQVFRSAESSS